MPKIDNSSFGMESLEISPNISKSREYLLGEVLAEAKDNIVTERFEEDLTKVRNEIQGKKVSKWNIQFNQPLSPFLIQYQTEKQNMFNKTIKNSRNISPRQENIEIWDRSLFPMNKVRMTLGSNFGKHSVDILDQQNNLKEMKYQKMKRQNKKLTTSVKKGIYESDFTLNEIEAIIKEKYKKEQLNKPSEDNTVFSVGKIAKGSKLMFLS